MQRLQSEIDQILSSNGVPKESIRYCVIDDSAGLDPKLQDLLKDSRTEVLTVPFNLGHQRAIVYGLRRLVDRVSDWDVVITLDSDGEDRPIDILRLQEAHDLSPQRFSIVLARRTKRKVSLSFQVLYACFVAMFRLLTGLVIRSGNFALFSGRTLRQIIHHPYFDLCYSSTLIALKIPLIEIPCERGERYFGNSKMGYFNLLMHGFRMLMPFMDRLAVRALVGSGLLCFLSLASGLGFLMMRFIVQTEVSNWYLLLTLILFIMAFLSIGTFILMFSIFSQMQGLVFARIESHSRKS